jgi:hypothetical protein
MPTLTPASARAARRAATAERRSEDGGLGWRRREREREREEAKVVQQRQTERKEMGPAPVG